MTGTVELFPLFQTGRSTKLDLIHLNWSNVKECLVVLDSRIHGFATKCGDMTGTNPPRQTRMCLKNELRRGEFSLVSVLPWLLLAFIIILSRRKIMGIINNILVKKNCSLFLCELVV